MRFILAWIRILTAVLLFGLLANYLYFAFLSDSSAAAGWALTLLLTAFLMCIFWYVWGWSMTRKVQKSPLDTYIEDVHKEEEILQQAAVVPAVKADEVTPVLEKLVAANAKNTTMLNLAMENLNARLDDLEDKFIRRQTKNDAPAPEPKEDKLEKVAEQTKAKPSGGYDAEFAGISDLEIMQEKPEENAKEYEEVDLDELLVRS